MDFLSLYQTMFWHASQNLHINFIFCILMCKVESRHPLLYYSVSTVSCFTAFLVLMSYYIDNSFFLTLVVSQSQKMKTRTLTLIYLFGTVITACRGQFTLCMPNSSGMSTCIQFCLTKNNLEYKKSVHRLSDH